MIVAKIRFYRLGVFICAFGISAFTAWRCFDINTLAAAGRDTDAICSGSPFSDGLRCDAYEMIIIDGIPPPIYAPLRMPYLRYYSYEWWRQHDMCATWHSRYAQPDNEWRFRYRGDYQERRASQPSTQWRNLCLFPDHDSARSKSNGAMPTSPDTAE